jgi:hypothetical protein
MKKIPEWVIRYGIPAAVLALGALVGLGAGAVWDHIGLRPAEGEEENLPAEDPGEGIGRVPAVVRYLADSHADEAERAWLLDEYTEGDSPVPAWCRGHQCPLQQTCNKLAIRFRGLQCTPTDWN